VEAPLGLSHRVILDSVTEDERIRADT
jgi:hypothetical protein